MNGPKGVAPFNLSSYPLSPKNVDLTASRLVQETTIEISNNPRLNERQKIHIREALGSAGAVSPKHPLHKLYGALKMELDPESSLRETPINDFAKRFSAKESNDVAGNTFLQTIQNKSSDLYLKGLAQSVEEDSEKSEQRQFAIFVYVTDNYLIPS